MCGGMEFNGFGLRRRTVLPDKSINVGSNERRLGCCCSRALYGGVKEEYAKIIWLSLSSAFVGFIGGLLAAIEAFGGGIDLLARLASSALFHLCTGS